MKEVLVFGAGRSTSYLIDYLTKGQGSEQRRLVVADQQSSAWIKEVLRDQDEFVLCDATDTALAEKLIEKSDLVVSMLPPHMHTPIAAIALEKEKDFFTASYLSDDIRAMTDKVEEKGLLFLAELGLDPGIDHMSAMNRIDELKAEGKPIVAFRSFTGGLVAKESDTNPWHYKFSWNPWNVVVAGQGGDALFIEQGETQSIPYHQLFLETWSVPFDGSETYEGYANRNSLPYRELYGLEASEDVIRGTLREGVFCKAWSVLVTMGITNNVREFPGKKSRKEFFEQIVIGGMSELVECMFAIHPHHLEEVKQCIDSLDLFSEAQVTHEKATGAQVLHEILMEKWALEPTDKDKVVMVHEFVSRQGDKLVKERHTLKVIGENARRTAMAKTVGLPLGIAISLRLSGQLDAASGVKIPTEAVFYQPILDALAEEGIVFNHQVVD